MDWVFILVLQIMLQPSLSVLFTVEAEQTLYKSNFGEAVVMGCRFQPKLLSPLAELKVTWHWIGNGLVRDVYRMDDLRENLASRDPDYVGRVRLLTDELQEGWAKLEISKLRINDSGNYQCLVQTKEGADYKTITLSVTAPYKNVTKHIQKVEEGDEVLLTCQSEGYPRSPVTWQDGHRRIITSNSTDKSSPNQLFKVTSQICVKLSDKNNYTCTFTNGGYSATFDIPDEISVAASPAKADAVIIVLSIGVVMVAIIVAVLVYRRRRKGVSTHSTRNLVVDGRDLQKNKDIAEETTIFNVGCVEENLGVFLKAHYSDSFSTEAKQHCDAVSVEELHHKLQNNKGQPLNLQALLPEAGETLFLEGPPESGKTTYAHLLVSSWTEGSTHALSNLLDLSALQLLFYVDCSKVKGSLYQEITTQLSLTEKISTEDELRTVLTRCSEALLLLDGYKEGNQYFDESLRKFLMEKGECRVLVTACPGHCPTLKGAVETERVLLLQTQIAKY